MPTPDFETLARLERKQEQARSAAENLLLEARSQGRETLTVGETERLRRMRADMSELDDQLVEMRAEVERANLTNPLLAKLRHNPQTARSIAMNDNNGVYRQHGGPSYLRDLMRTTLNMDSTNESRRRLSEHAEDIERRDLSRVDGSGGYAVPPAWLMSQYIDLARPGRPFANLVQRQPLPGGTDSINIPKILTGTSVAVQTADNQPVSDTDLTDTFINAPVRTISGQQGLAIQLIDQSPIAFDDVVFRDLVAAHGTQVDIQTLYGTGTNGQVLGVLQTPNIGTVTPSSIDIKGVYSAIANAIQTVHVTRFLPPEVIVMHPRRWGWLLSLLDTNNRPLFLPTENGPYNVPGLLTDVDSQQVVGRSHGLPIVTDPNITTTAGTGNNEDQIIVARVSDLVLWESGIRARVLPETKASNLTVLLQVYSYIAFSASRYPQSVVVIQGGLTPPTF